MDETSKQLIRETRLPVDVAPGQPRRVDYEYERKGVEISSCSSSRCAVGGACGSRRSVARSNGRGASSNSWMSTILKPSPGPGCETSIPTRVGPVRGVSRRRGEAVVGATGGPRHPQARQLVEHGGNRAERLSGQCLDRRIDEVAVLRRKLDRWRIIETERRLRKGGGSRRRTPGSSWRNCIRCSSTPILIDVRSRRTYQKSSDSRRVRLNP